MIQVPFDTIDWQVINDLLVNKVAEKKTLDYKASLPNRTDKAIKDFLADVCSFANTSGGHIVYGVSEKRNEKSKTGLPEAIVGITGETADEAIRRLENVIRDSIRPRVKVQTKQIQDPKSSFEVVVMYIPQSLSAPHMVTHGGSSRFHARDSRGKYLLDVDQIRSAFLAAESVPERIRQFREQRLAQIIADETPVPLLQSHRVVLHTIPISAFQRPSSSQKIVFTAEMCDRIRGITSAHNYQHNFDGYVGRRAARNGQNIFYTQMFRNGIIETAHCKILNDPEDADTLHQIHSAEYERQIIAVFLEHLKILKALGVEPPALLVPSFLGVMGFSMRNFNDFATGCTIDRDNLILPDILVESSEVKPEIVLKDAFDLVWQACGFGRSHNYDDEGHRKHDR
jgi:hypothetical protein